MSTYIYEGSVRAPRWKRVDLAIREGCQALNLVCTIDRETTLLREHIFFTLSGSWSGIQTIKEWLEGLAEQD